MSAGPSHPGCNAGMSFTALRDASPFPAGKAARRFFVERLQELASASERLADQRDRRVSYASRQLRELATRAAKGFVAEAATRSLPQWAPAHPTDTRASSASVEAVVVREVLEHDGEGVTTTHDGVEYVQGKGLTLIFAGRRCIHARICVTHAPKVFLANVEGPWIHPDAMSTERLVEIAHGCPSGAIRYQRKDGGPDETPPPVNLLMIREAGPYALRSDLRIDGEPMPARATLCRCGASKREPFCDGSHHEVKFAASGEPATADLATLDARDGPLEISTQLDGPLQVRGNLEVVSGTGRVVSRLMATRLCRCGASGKKPFCDGSHARVGFRSG